MSSSREDSGISEKQWARIDKIKHRLMVNARKQKTAHDARLMMVGKKNSKKNAEEREKRLMDVERDIRRLETERDELEESLRATLR